MQTNICQLISPAAPRRADSTHEEVEYYDVESSTYDPAFDVPDLSDTEGDNFLHVQEDRVSQWRQDSQQPSNIVR